MSFPRVEDLMRRFLHRTPRRVVPQFEARLTLTGPKQLICRACGAYTVVDGIEQGQAWTSLRCPHTVPAPPVPVGGVADLIGKAAPWTPVVGIRRELLRAGGR